MKIEITREDIDKGLIGDPRYCPLALALRRYGNLERIGYQTYTMNDKIYTTPVAAGRFIYLFDSNAKGRKSIHPVTLKFPDIKPRPITLELPIIKHTFFSRLLANLLRRF